MGWGQARPDKTQLQQDKEQLEDLLRRVKEVDDSLKNTLWEFNKSVEKAGRILIDLNRANALAEDRARRNIRGGK